MSTKSGPAQSAQDLASIDTINRRLWAYVEGEYHQTPHRGLGELTPLDAWVQRAAHIKPAGARLDIEELFLFEEKRKVARDRTVSLHGIVFEVDATLVGQTVVLRYDPDRPRGPVQVIAQGVRAADAKPVDKNANCFVRRNPPPAADAVAPVAALRLRDLAKKEER